MFSKFEGRNSENQKLAKQKKRIKETLSNYLPEGCIEYVVELMKNHPTKFKIVRPRKTKLGDFRWNPVTKERQITVNGNLAPFSFLVTTLHEFAHLIAFEKHGNRIQSHGKEWKNTYRDLLIPLIERRIFPLEIENALLNSINSMKASSCNDLQLQRALRFYEDSPSDELLLEEIPKNSTFVLNGRIFRRKELRRTRFLCEEISTGKPYLINRLARVSLKE